MLPESQCLIILLLNITKHNSQSHSDINHQGEQLQYMNYDYNIMLEIKRTQANHQELYLLLAVKSLTQYRQFKKYILKINSLDNHNECQIDNLFQHNCEYVYKLWPCGKSRQFVRIQMFEVVGRDQLIKRGQASPVILYSEQGQKFQFSGSQDQKCVLILKFKINKISCIQEQITNKQLVQLNEDIDWQLDKNKKQIQSFNKYLDKSSRFINNLKNQRYLTEDDPAPVRYNIQDQQITTSQYEIHPLPAGLHNIRQSLSNNKYIERIISQPSPRTDKLIENPYLQQINEQIISLPYNPKTVKKNDQIANQIKSRRNAYSTANMSIQITNKPISFMKQSTYIHQRQKQSIEPTIHSLKQLSNRQSQVKPKLQTLKQQNISLNQSKVSQVVRTNDFPAKPNKKIKKAKSYSQNKEEAQPDTNRVKKLDEVDLKKVFSAKTELQVNEQDELLRIQLIQVRAYFFKCNYELPKKLVVHYERQKHQSFSQKMRNKQVQWKDQIIVIQKARSSLPLGFKIISVRDFSTLVEGQAQVLIKQLVKASQFIKVYLHCNQIVIGYLQVKMNIKPFIEQDPTQISTIRVKKQRKTISLPQISKPTKVSKRYGNDKESRLAHKSIKQSMSISKSKIERRKSPSIYIGKIKEKKLKLKPKLS